MNTCSTKETAGILVRSWIGGGQSKEGTDSSGATASDVCMHTRRTHCDCVSYVFVNVRERVKWRAGNLGRLALLAGMAR